MRWTMRTPGSTGIVGLDAVLRDWEPAGGCASGFQSGDLGWELRHGAAATARRLRCWQGDDGTIGAIGVMEGDASLWLAIDAGHLMDGALAEAIAAWAVDAALGSIGVPAVPALIRTALGRRGFAIDPDAWLYFWKPLTDDNLQPVVGVWPTSTPELVRQRITVKRAADDADFSLEQWRAMAAGPAFRPELDLVAVNDDGVGVSALTAWLPGPGRCGVIKAMGTHPGHRRQGHARRALAAACSALRRLGASGVRVFADRDNDAANALYKATGFQVIGYDTEMILSGRRP